MEQKQEFTLREQHLKLLSRMNVGWDDAEFGAPCIDPKRPYGNSSVINDLAEILGLEGKTCPHCGEYLEEQDEERLTNLHKETETALQIVLSTQSFKPGTYIADKYGIDWKLKEEQGEKAECNEIDEEDSELVEKEAKDVLL